LAADAGALIVNKVAAHESAAALRKNIPAPADFMAMKVTQADDLAPLPSRHIANCAGPEGFSLVHRFSLRHAHLPINGSAFKKSGSILEKVFPDIALTAARQHRLEREESVVRLALTARAGSCRRLATR
jgi:hypothetical protein